MHESEEQYNMCFRSQIDGMATMTEIHQSRLQDLVNLHESERENLLEESEIERKKMDNKTLQLYSYTCNKLCCIIHTQ